MVFEIKSNEIDSNLLFLIPAVQISLVKPGLLLKLQHLVFKREKLYQQHLLPLCFFVWPWQPPV